MPDVTIHLDELSLYMVLAGRKDAPCLLFVHGWPQTSRAFGPVMAELEDTFRVAAIDLPGVGGSVGQPRSADKRTLARYIEAAISAAGLERVTLIGHDIGGQTVYAFLRVCPGAIERAAILDVVIPGIEPWPQVIRSPRIWHFAFHAVQHLPEHLVGGREAAHFDFFFDTIATHPGAITSEARRAYADGYSSAASLTAGFDWYRAFAQDAKDNAADQGGLVATPVLCVRGDNEGGELRTYVDGLRHAGLVNVSGRLIGDCGHFSPEEQPKALAAALRDFLNST